MIQYHKQNIGKKYRLWKSMACVENVEKRLWKSMAYVENWKMRKKDCGKVWLVWKMWKKDCGKVWLVWKMWKSMACVENVEKRLPFTDSIQIILF